jgi:hypothetical protein
MVNVWCRWKVSLKTYYRHVIFLVYLVHQQNHHYSLSMTILRVCQYTRRTIYHSLTVKLLYFSKRIRPDLLTVVSFLTTRVQKPTSEDLFEQSILPDTDMVSTLCADKYLLIMVFVNAAFGVHRDR